MMIQLKKVLKKSESIHKIIMNKKKSSLINNIEKFNQTVGRSSYAASISYSIIGSIIIFCLFGYLFDYFFKTNPFGVLGGVLIGVFSGLYLLAKYLFLKK